jgi:hypothetical protein
LHLVLENQRNDFRFLFHLADSKSRDRLQELEAGPGKVQIHGGGTGEMDKWLEELEGFARTNPTRFWRCLLKSVFIFDRDAGGEDATLPSDSSAKRVKRLKALKEAGRGTGPTWIQWGRREIESFVPDSGLAERASTEAQRNLADQVSRWRESREESRLAWCIDLKKGLMGDLRPGIDEQTRDALKNGTQELLPSQLKRPFDRFAPDVVRALKHGYFKRLSEALNPTHLDQNLSRWHADIPNEYDRGPEGQASRQKLIQSIFDRI